MTERVDVPRTYKLFIGGGFPRSESGRSLAVTDARGTVITHVARASRKDLRDAVEAARGALGGWSSRSAYNRGQILYRMAEMLEGQRQAFVDALRAPSRGVKGATTAASANREVAAAIDRLVVFAGWADKYAQVLGCQNPVDGPFYNYTAPEPTGVVAMVPPEAPALLALVSLLAPPLCAGNTTVVIADVGAGPAARAPNPLPAAIFGEVCATSDVPAGVINILTATHSEVLPHLASHRDVDAISGANLSKDATAMLELGAAENVKRVRIERIAPESAWYESERLESPWAIEPFVEMKTIWHPASAM